MAALSLSHSRHKVINRSIGNDSLLNFCIPSARLIKNRHENWNNNLFHKFRCGNWKTTFLLITMSSTTQLFIALRWHWNFKTCYHRQWLSYPISAARSYKDAAMLFFWLADGWLSMLTTLLSLANGRAHSKDFLNLTASQLLVLTLLIKYRGTIWWVLWSFLCIRNQRCDK